MAQQTDVPVFRGGIDEVQLSVLVLDKQRRPVKGLTAADFVVTDGGARRVIDGFLPVTLPETPESTADTNPEWIRQGVSDVTTNQRASDGRLVIIMMDRSIPMEEGTVAARKIARAAVDALGPGDLAAVVYDSGFASEGASQNVTGDRGRLLAAIDAPFMGLVNPPDEADGLRRGEPDIRHTGDCVCGLCVLESIAKVADALAAETVRQKMILWIGSALVIQERPMDPVECYGLVRGYREQAMRALDRANVTFHALDPSGLETLARTAGGFRADPKNSPRRTLERQADLAVLPSYTGGRTVVNTNRAEDAIPSIFDESSAYYLIAIARGSGTGERDDERRIHVKVNRPGVTIRTRRGYFSQTPTSVARNSGAPPRSGLDAAIAGLLPRGEVPLRLEVTPSFSASGEPDVSVAFAIEGLASRRGGIDVTGPADVLIGVFDADARAVSSRRLAVALPRDTAVARHVERLSLRPGRYEVRIGVSLGAPAATGSVYGYVDVPAVSRDELSVSAVTFRAGDALSEGPALRRTFASGERVSASVQVRPGISASRSVSVHMAVEGARGQIVTTTATTIEAARFDTSPVVEQAVEVPVASLAPGTYRLMLDVSDGKSIERRTSRFDVAR
jgi:VWFA-related protein